MTCEFSAFLLRVGGSLSPASHTVTWYRNDKTFTTGVTSPADTRSLYTVTTADESHNGVYQCKVTYGEHGTAASSKVTQYVRYLAPSTNIFGVLNENLDITCTFYGDALGATTWLKGSTPIATGGQYTITAGNYKSQKRMDTLRISTLTAQNAGDFICKASYTADSHEVSSTQTLTISDIPLSASVVRNPSEAVVSQGSGVAFTCTYTAKQMGPSDGTITTAWTLNDKPLDSSIVIDKNTPQKETFQLTQLGSLQNGMYKCTVTYGVFGDISADNKLLIQDVAHTENVYAMNGAKVSLTCKAYGDEPTSITWNDGAKDFTKTDAEVTDSTYANYFVESVFVVASATTSKAYKCTVVYSGPKSIEKTTNVAVLQPVCEFLKQVFNYFA